jgi:hypothetical protein
MMDAIVYKTGKSSIEDKKASLARPKKNNFFLERLVTATL